METHVRTYRKVRIYREIEYTVNLKEMSDGSIKELKPHETRWYKLIDGVRHYTLDEVKESIDWCIEQALARDIPEALMVQTLNEPSPAL